MNRNVLAFLAFVAACVFFGVAVFGVSLGGVPLLAAGLFCVAIGLAIGSVPA